MVTAPAPVSADSRFPAAASTQPFQTPSAVSFASVYQDLPQALLDQLIADGQAVTPAISTGNAATKAGIDPNQASKGLQSATERRLWAPSQTTATLSVAQLPVALQAAVPKLIRTQAAAAPSHQSDIETPLALNQPAIASPVIPQSPALSRNSTAAIPPLSSSTESKTAGLENTHTETTSALPALVAALAPNRANEQPPAASDQAASRAQDTHSIAPAPQLQSARPTLAPASLQPGIQRQAATSNLPAPPSTEVAPTVISPAVSSQAKPSPVRSTKPVRGTSSQEEPANPGNSASTTPTQAAVGLPPLVAPFSTNSRGQNSGAQEFDTDESTPRTTRQLAGATADKGISTSLMPRVENMAFSLRLATPDSGAKHGQSEPQPAVERTKPASESKTAHAPEQLSNPAERTLAQDHSAVEVTARAATITWHDSTPATTHLTPAIELSEPPSSIHSNVVASLHEIPAMPEAPRTPASSEILLQLGGKDQPAAIRLSERGGAVNVSVHAADPELRSTLRSNLNDLTTQLSHQGWKAESVKTGTLLTRAGSTPDSRSDTEHQSSQQNFSNNGSDRQPQRDRRGNSAQWLNEFEEQTSGNSGGRS